MNPESSQPLSPLRRALFALEDLQAKLNAAERARTEAIAIVSMGCRFPGGADQPSAFWDLLHNRIDAITEVPLERWNVGTYYSERPQVPGTINTRYGGFVGNRDEFDALFFGIAPREAVKLDPQQRLLLEVTWEALESGNIVPESLFSSLTGVFIGISSFDYALRLFGEGHPDCIDAYAGTGTLLSPAAGRLSYILGLTGPSFVVDTACSSSLLAVHLACQSLRNQECNLAIAGGVNRLLSPQLSINFSQAGMLSPDGRCKTFDGSANGFVRSEGCGVIVLKRLSDALADNDRILAVIRGSAVNQDGRTSGLTAPNGPSQQAVIRQALANAQVTPAEVDYVETHGTGTALGDPIEVGALAAVFASERSPDHPLAISSVKTNIGHTEAAAGIAGLIKVVLSLQHQEIPAHLHFKQPNPYIDWQKLPFKVPTESMPWLSGEKPRIAGVSGFGFAGTNVHVVVEEAPPKPGVEKPIVFSSQERPQHLLTLSAKSSQGLTALAQKYCQYLIEYPDRDLADICFTANTGRSHFLHRLTAIAASTPELSLMLQAFTRGESVCDLLVGEVSRTASPKIAFFFDNNGFDPPSWQEVYQTQPTFAVTLDRCAELLVLPVGEIFSSPISDVSIVDQKIHFALAYSLSQLLQSWGIKPHWVWGEGVGEYVAATVAGVFSLEEGCQLIAHLQAFDRLEVAQQINYSLPQIPMVDCRTGAVFGEETATSRYWESRLEFTPISSFDVNPIRDLGCEFWVEIGGRSLQREAESQNLSSSRVQVLPTQSFKESNWRSLFTCLSTLYLNCVSIDWFGFDRGYSRRALQLPTYAWQRQRYWLEVEHSSKPSQINPPISRQQSDHPLLGMRLNSPLKTCIFQTNISSNFPEFLADHRVFERTIFPASCYLEMALFAGKKLLNSSNLRVFEVNFEKALVLNERQIKTIQIILNPMDSTEYGFEIFSQDSETESEWILHCRGKISGRIREKQLQTEGINLENISKALPKISIENYYQKLQGWGVELKASFQTLKCLYQGENGFAGCIEIPPSLQSETHPYILHPLLLDGGLQVAVASILNRDETHSYLPVGVEHLEIFDQAQSRLWVKVQSLDHPSSSSPLLSYNISLFDETGKTIAVLQGVNFQMSSSPKSSPNWFYQVEWIRQIQSRNLSLEYPMITASELGELVHIEPSEIIPQSELESYENALKNLNDLGVKYILEAFDQLGWKWRRGETFSSADISSKIGGVNSYNRLWDRMLEILAEKGYLKARLERWEVLQIPERVEIASSYHQLLAEYPIAQAEITLLGRCGSNLAEVLTGKSELLQLLFPGGDVSILRPIYQNSPVAQIWNHLIQKTLEVWLNKIAKFKEINVLEVGAGTGGTTASLLPLFNPEKTRYVYSDVGASFLKQAAQKFANYSFVKYQVLDLEKDLESQGFSSEKYDLILAANVLHATADLSQTLKQVKQLLVPGGLLIILEETEKQPWIDLTFGLTEGWWKFKDLSLRRNYPLLKASQWLTLLSKQGFKNPAQISPKINVGQTYGQPALIVAQADSVESNPSNLQPKTWLIFADKTGVADGLNQQIKAQGERSILVWANSKFQSFSPQEFHLNPTQPQDFQQLLQEISKQSLAGIIHCWSLDVASSEDLTETDLKQASELGCASTLHLLQALTGAEIEKPPRLWLVTENAISVNSDNGGLSGLAQAPLWGMGKVITLEHPEFNCVLVDLEGKERSTDVQQLWTEVQHPTAENQVAFRHRCRWVAKLVQPQQSPTPHLELSQDCTYLITGGNGGLGLKVAEWLVQRGIRHLVLVGRTGIKPSGERTLAQLERAGARIWVRQADVCQKTQMQQLLREIESSLPPLRGIIHGVGVLDDGVIQHLSWERFARVMAPKVEGAWLLHELTKHLEIEDFVLFSSAAALLGNSGQANHAAANGFLDALAAHRRGLGLSSLSINWGPWAEIGAASERLNPHQWEIKGMAQFTPDEGLEVLQQVFRGGYAQVGVISVNWSKLMTSRSVSPFLAGFASSLNTQKPETEPLQGQLQGVSAKAQRALVMDHVRFQVGDVLGLSSATLDVNQGFFDMGMDSLTSVELRNRLQSSLNCNLPSTLTFTYPTVAQLVSYLLDEILVTQVEEKSPTLSTQEPESSSVLDLENLNDDELASLLAQKLANLD